MERHGDNSFTKVLLPSEVLMLLLPLTESRTGIHLLPEFFPTMSQTLCNLDFISGKNENIYYGFLKYISTLKVKNGRVFLCFKMNALNNFFTAEKVSSFCFLLFHFLSSSCFYLLIPKEESEGTFGGNCCSCVLLFCFFKVQNDGEVEMTLVLKKVKVKNKENGFKKF